MNIGIVYNSFSYKEPLPEEREMRDTALAIGKYLSRSGRRVLYFDMDSSDGIAALCASQVDVAFNACERIRDDARGEVYAAALLEFLGIPHTRTSAWLVSLGISKARVKSILAYHHIPTPHYQVFHTEHDPLFPNLKYPLFVKGLASENSIGIDEHSLVHDRGELEAKVEQILTNLRQPALVEEYIAGREFSVAILPGAKNQVLPISEIVFYDLPPESRFLDYDAKWYSASDRYQKTVPICPAQLTKLETRMIGETALHCYNVLGLDSYARIDIRYRDKTPYVLEVNQNPSINEEDSGYVRTCRGIGLNYTDMIDMLLRNAMVKNSENMLTRTGSLGCGYRNQDPTNIYPLETARL
jgi:D-alanine-D-alanine ligase